MTNHTAMSNAAAVMTVLSNYNEAKDVIEVYSSRPPELLDVDKLLNLIAKAHHSVQAYDFQTEDDRKLAKSVRAKTTRWLQDIRKAVKDYLAEQATPINEQLAMVSDSASELINELDSKLKQFDDAFRAKRKQELLAEYRLRLDAAIETCESLTVYRDNTDMFDELFDAMFEPSWLNRTASVMNASEEMADKFISVTDLIQDDALGLNGEQAVSHLVKKNWSYRDARRLRLDEIKAEELLQKELDDDEDNAATEPAVQSAASVTVKVTLPYDQVSVLRSIADTQGWTVKL